MLSEWLKQLEVDPWFIPEEPLPVVINADDSTSPAPDALVFMSAYEKQALERERLTDLAWEQARFKIQKYKHLGIEEGQPKLFAYMAAELSVKPFISLSDDAKTAIISTISSRLFRATDEEITKRWKHGQAALKDSARK